MHKYKHILAAPFAFSPYGYTANTAYQNILEHKSCINYCQLN